MYLNHPHSLPPLGLGPQPRIDPLPEYTASQETTEERSWRSVVISGIERRIDMKVGVNTDGGGGGAGGGDVPPHKFPWRLNTPCRS